MEKFLYIHGTYAWALPVLFATISTMVTLKSLLKIAMVSFATGHLYRVQVKVKWFAIYLDVSDHGIFLSDKKGIIVVYQVATAMAYFFISSVGGALYPHDTVQATLNTMALLLSLADTHPYHRSDLTKLFSTILGERPLRHMIPFLKSRSLLPMIFRRSKIQNEKSYQVYSAIALAWVFIAMLISMKILSQNWPLLKTGWVLAPFGDFISRTVISFSLLVLFLYSLSDLTTTLIKNILRPVANPLMKLVQTLKRRPVPARERPELEGVLERLMVFENISASARAFLIGESVVMRFVAGANLIIQGTTGRELFVLCKGAVDIVRREPTGLQSMIATLQAPAVFGEIGVIRNIPRTADVISRGEVEVMIIDKDVFDRMLREGSMELDRKRLLEKFTLSHYISSSPLFAQLPIEAIHIFSHRGTIESFKKDTPIIKEGEVSKSFYLLLEGSVEVLKMGEKVTELKSGDFFGEIALIADLPRTASIRTTADCMCLRLDQDVFWEILAAHVHIAMSLESIAETRLEEIKCSA
jgi:CRP-like cAMP-binding protein